MGETGGSHGLGDIGLLESALARPQAIFEGQELCPDIFAKAVALMDALIRNYPSVDGNERTGVTAAAIFLRRKGWLLKVSNRELEALTLQVAGAGLSISQGTRWLKKHCTLDLS